MSKFLTNQNMSSVIQYLVRIALWTDSRVLVNATADTKSTSVSESAIGINYVLASIIQFWLFVQHKWNLCIETPQN